MIKNFMSMGKFVGDINTPEEMFKLISSLLKLNTCNADDVTQYNGLISRDVLAYLKEDIDKNISKENGRIPVTISKEYNVAEAC